jgi:hypothetical protein
MGRLGFGPRQLLQPFSLAASLCQTLPPEAAFEIFFGIIGFVFSSEHCFLLEKMDAGETKPFSAKGPFAEFQLNRLRGKCFVF